VKKEDLIPELIKSLEVPSLTSEEGNWNAIQSKISSEVEVKTPKGLIRRLAPLMAAASVILAIWIWFPTDASVNYSNTDRGVKEVILADGSEISLLPESELEVVMTSSERSLILKGEAFFNVTKGVPFTVSTEFGKIEVLGTSFSVNSRNMLDVQCFTGRVNVSSKDQKIQLTKGLGVNSLNMASTYTHNNIQKMDESNNISFDEQNLNSIISDLNVYRDMKIQNFSKMNPLLSLETAKLTNLGIIKVISQISGLELKVVGENNYELY